MSRSKASKINGYYRIVRYGDYEYEHLEVDVYVTPNIKDLDYSFFNRNFFTIKWQGNCNKREEGWYAGRICVESTDPEFFAKVASLAKTLDMGFMKQPSTVIDTLRNMGYKQVTRIPEIGYVIVEDWQDSYVYRVDLGDHIFYCVLAREEKDAKDKFAKIAHKDIDEGNYIREWAEWFMKKDVKCISQLYTYEDLSIPSIDLQVPVNA